MNIENLLEKLEGFLAAGKEKTYTLAKCIYVRVEGNRVRIEVSINWQGKRYRKFFILKENYEEVTKEALEWRDCKEKELGKPRTERLVQIRFNKPTNTGYLGIRCDKLTSNRKKPSPYIRVVCINQEGKRRCANYSISKHGNANALELAKNFYRNNHYLREVYFLLDKRRWKLIEEYKESSRKQKRGYKQ